MDPALATIQRLACGSRGGCGRRSPASESRRSSLRELHDRHDATTLSQAWGPPRDRGTTWSMFSAARLQYWQRWPSRANTARRESGTRLRYGTRTKWCSRITDGIGSWARSECRTAPLRTMISAFSFSTSTTARRIGTTQSGSKLALSSRALPKRRHLPDQDGFGRSCSAASLPAQFLAPVEILDQVVGVGAAVGAVLGLEPELQVLGVGQREERRPR